MSLFWKINHDFLNPSGLPIKIGDFGEMDKETGSFQREGNIFEHPDSKDIMAHWNDLINVVTIDHIFQRTGNVRQIDLPIGVGAGLTGTVEGNVTAQFQFTKKRGVLLCMYDVKHSVVPVLKTWVKALRDIPLFKAKVFVTETHTCSHYTLVMQTKGKRAVGVTARAAVPIPVAPAITASANVGFDVSGVTDADLLWQKTKSAECDSFVPMYHLKTIATTAPSAVSRLVHYFSGSPGVDLVDDSDADDSDDFEFGEPLLFGVNPPSNYLTLSGAADDPDVFEEFGEPLELDDAPPAPLAPSSDMHGVPVYEEFSEPGEPVELDDTPPVPLAPSSDMHGVPVYEEFSNPWEPDELDDVSPPWSDLDDSDSDEDDEDADESNV